jgi:hypothetical protein
MEYIEAYFEACKTIDEERDEDINEARPKTPQNMRTQKQLRRASTYVYR